MVESTLEDEEEGAEELLQARAAADSEAFDQAIKEQQREEGDRFEEMVKHEEDIRLGDEGWKERYYQVRVRLLCTQWVSSGSASLEGWYCDCLGTHAEPLRRYQWMRPSQWPLHS